MSDRGDLRAFLDLAWQHISRGVADRRAPARHPTFATVSPDGAPEARTVVLRRADRALGVLEVHTDSATPKVASLRANPRAQLHVWIPKAQMQLRLSARVEILTGAAVQDRWAQVPPASRVSYGTRPDPGQPIAAVDAYDKPADPARFAVLACHLTRIEVLQLDQPHRRAVYEAAGGWAGTWVAP